MSLDFHHLSWKGCVLGRKIVILVSSYSNKSGLAFEFLGIIPGISQKMGFGQVLHVLHFEKSSNMAKKMKQLIYPWHFQNQNLDFSYLICH